MDVEKWQLIRCVYDYDICCNEIENPDKFAEIVKEGATVSYLIGKTFIYNKKPSVKVILEGDKEILEYVLKKMKGGEGDKMSTYAYEHIHFEKHPLSIGQFPLYTCFDNKTKNIIGFVYYTHSRKYVIEFYGGSNRVIGESDLYTVSQSDIKDIGHFLGQLNTRIEKAVTDG